MGLQAWRLDFIDYITQSLNGDDTDSLELTDRLISFKEDTGANQYDKVISIQDIVDLATVSFDSDRPTTRVGIPIVNVGGSTVVEFLEEYFYPAIYLTIDIDGTLSTIVQVGTSNIIVLTGNVTLNDDAGSNSGTLKLDGTSIHSFTTALTYSKSITFTPIKGSSNPTELLSNSYIAYATGDTSSNVVNSSTKVLTAVYPYLHGVSSSDLIVDGTTIYTTLDKLVQSKGNKIITFNGVGFMYYSFPASYGELTSIKDENNFEFIGSFTKSTINVSSIGLSNNWVTESYYVYKSNLSATQTNKDYTFYI
jgi:hypothetical protein